MNSSSNWKTALLRSSMPLEMEASRLLVDEGFTVNAAFKYAWSDSEDIRDSAVDIHARALLPVPELEDSDVQVELLVNCSPRHPDVSWLFLPDPNRPETSPVRPGNALRIVDQFAPYVISPAAWAEFEGTLPVCYRGIEVEMETGRENGPAFRQGLSRMQNALPRLFTENTMDFLSGPRSENLPFLFCPVLITNAPLFVIRPGVNLDRIAAADRVEEIAERHPYLVIHSDYSPDFKARCISETGPLRELVKTEKAMEIEMKKVRYYNSHANLPFTIIDALNAAEYHYLSLFFTQFVICSHGHFPTLINRMKQTIETALATCEPL